MHDDNIMWDDESKSIKIIDTDFFKKINEKSNLKNINYQSFAGTLQGIIDAKINEYGKNENEQFNPFYDVTSLKYKDGKKLSINEYILNLKNVVENDFGKNFNNLSEIEKALKEKQYNFEEKQHMEQIANNLTLKEKIIRALVKGKYLRKIPFVNKIINKNIKMLPSDVKEVVCDKREQFRKELRNFEPNIEPKAKKNDLNMERQNEVNNHDEIELK